MFAPSPVSLLPAESSFSSRIRRTEDGGGGGLRHPMSSSAVAYQHAHDRTMMPFQLDDELANLGTRALEELSADDNSLDHDDEDEDGHRGLSGAVMVGSDRQRQRLGWNRVYKTFVAVTGEEEGYELQD
ncbi:hypothetical protein DFQ26_000954 [Actinomortierella ambigua]|nr:hypothetical protein DFQ26_000954 [Actinomortierella ambigua]